MLTVKEQVTVMHKAYNDQGCVAVLYSPGFGAGWYTWNLEYPAIMFDPNIVHIILDETLDKKEKIERITVYATLKYPNAYLGGAGDLTVMWIDEGKQFKIGEYDGSESIEFRDSDDWFIA
jgi:hypothetical protein